MGRVLALKGREAGCICFAFVEVSQINDLSRLHGGHAVHAERGSPFWRALPKAEKISPSLETIVAMPISSPSYAQGRGVRWVRLRPCRPPKTRMASANATRGKARRRAFRKALLSSASGEARAPAAWRSIRRPPVVGAPNDEFRLAVAPGEGSPQREARGRIEGQSLPSSSSLRQRHGSQPVGFSSEPSPIKRMRKSS